MLMKNENAIEVRRLNKYYQQHHALRDVSLSVRNGERIVICGPSGSGKSTLIRCMNQLEKHQSGEIVLLGNHIVEGGSGMDAIRSEVGMVFQHFNLFPHMTILENCILAPMLVRKLPRAEAVERAMMFLERVHIPEQADKYPGELSGGQQQRVAIARSLCMMPRIMLFDEPTSALDPEMISEVLDVMIELAMDGQTMVCVTHEMAFARKVADRIVFMDKGQIIEEAEPGVFFTAPEHPRTREFLSQVMSH